MRADTQDVKFPHGEKLKGLHQLHNEEDTFLNPLSAMKS